ncbi:MAG TPA: adenylate/guanylate cyclase domain-containing protein [Kiloniellales bacterium]|nr:adenylate/guanylate cyclase domain-containing protein [Kiloniellales bacterium]
MAYWSLRLPSLLLLLLALVLKIGEPKVLQDLRLDIFDLYQRLHPRPFQEVGVRIVDVDDESLRRLGQWPWSRARVADLVDRLAQLQVAAIGFDMVFAEPDRLSPEQIVHDLKGLVPEEQLQNALKVLPDSDRRLAEAVGRAPAVLGFVLVSQQTPDEPQQKWGEGFTGDNPLLFLRPYAGAITNLKTLEEAAPGNGSFNAVPDRDGTIRRVFLMFQKGGRILPALSSELLRVAQGASTYLIKSSGASDQESFGSQSGIVSVKIGALEVPTDWEGALWLHFTGPRPERFVPAWKVLDGSVDPNLLAGHIVLIGTSAAGLKDLRASPLDPAGPGVEIHAQALEQMILGVKLVRPDWAHGAELAFIGLLGLFLVWFLPRLSPGTCIAVGVVALLMALGASWAAFVGEGLLFDPVMPAVSVLLIFLAGSFSGYLRTERERARVRNAFSLYLAPEMVSELARSSEKLTLGGEQRMLSVMFTDIRSFSKHSEELSPAELTSRLNRFFTPMTDQIQSHRGTIDKYIGDCIMAFWNAPLTDAEHGRHACQAALAMRKAVVAFNEELEAETKAAGTHFREFKIGIGLSCGECLVGNMGSNRRFSYSALGEAVNQASRIEGQCKPYGVDIIVSGPLRARAPDLAYVFLDRVRLVGASEATELYFLVGDATLAKAPAFVAWQEAQDAMRAAMLARNWAMAEQHLQAAHDAAGPNYDKLYALYQERINDFRAEPPGETWDGIVVATEK